MPPGHSGTLPIAPFDAPVCTVPRPSVAEILLVERAELDRLGNMRRLDIRRVGEIGDRPRDAQDTVVAPRTHTHSLERALEKSLSRLVRAAIIGDLRARHFRIACVIPSETLGGDVPRRDHALPDL